MTFNLDQLIHKNYEQTLKDYLNVNSLENYDIKIDELLPKRNNPYFNICFALTYKLTLLKNNILAITATSKTYNNQIFSLTNQNHIKKLYDSNSIDFLTINSFKETNSEIESKAYSLTISDKTKGNKRFNFLLQIQKISTYISTTPFAEKYLVEYKRNKNIETWSNELKKNLIDNYKEEKLIPYREDAAYKKIENFKPYELTYKIFYEMAIRNENAKRILHALNYLYNISAMQKNEIYIDELHCMVKSDERVYTVAGTVNINDIADYKIFVSLNNCKFKCLESIHRNRFNIEIIVDKEMDSLDLFVTLESEKYKDHKAYLGLPVAHSTLMIRSTTTGVLKNNKKMNISVKIDNIKYSANPDKDGSWLLDLNSAQKAFTPEIILQKYHSFLKPEEHQIYFSTGIYVINELIEELETQLIEEYLIYPDNYDVNHPEKKDILFQRALNNALDVQKLQDDPTYKHKDKYFFKQDDYDGYSIYQGILKDSDSRYNLSIIKQDTTKQVVDYNISNFQINLNLPKQELLDYLSKVKDNYDNDNSILMSPMELLGKDICIEPEDIRNMNSNKWADIFYIYDKFQYWICMQKQLEKEKEKLTDELNQELSPYKNVGPKTSHEKIKIRNIIKKYDTQEYEKKIDELGKTSQTKYAKLANEIKSTAPTIRSYITFMDLYIDETKYKEYLHN